MNIVFLFLGAMASGVFGGMGFGGGTLLIPLLTIMFGFNQKLAQMINLLSFSIMASIVVIILSKNRLVNIKVAIKFAILASIASILGAVFANMINVSILRKLFGGLLICVSIYETILQIKKIFMTKNAIKK